MGTRKNLKGTYHKLYAKFIYRTECLVHVVPHMQCSPQYINRRDSTTSTNDKGFEGSYGRSFTNSNG